MTSITIALRRSAAALAVCSSTAGAQAIVIDVGHSIGHPGATSAGGISEFQFNRTLALSIAEELAKSNLRVRVVGSDGDLDNIPQRTNLEANASLVVSIHHDSVKPEFLGQDTTAGDVAPHTERFSGFALFVSRKNMQINKSLACASAIGRSLRQFGFKPSYYHADPNLGEGRTFADRNNGVHFFDDLIILKRATSAAVLLEAGVIVNREEEKLLRSPDTISRIAQAVALAVASCIQADAAKRLN